MKTIRAICLVAVFSLSSLEIARAIVKYDEGSMVIDGIQLFQDREIPEHYYYIPPYPRLAQAPEGNFEFLCIKYIGQGGKETNGGLFHALIQFTLAPEEVARLEKKLKEKMPKGKIMGVVPMMEAVKDGEAGYSSFKIVSSILNNTAGANPFTLNVITSGRAPLLPGSKAAIAARLSQDGATLLWESFKAGTSDVSVVVEGFFEAAVKGYNAVVQADLEQVYNHFSSFSNKQGGFSREQARKSIDSLCQNQVIKIDVFDRSAGLGIKNEDMQQIVDLITEKIVSLMFDTKAGWAKMPETESAIMPNEIKERYKRGDFVAFFAGQGDQEYIPDNQLLLKEKKSIKQFKFFLNLSKSTTIKVPVYTAGNIRGFYDLAKDDDRYFRVINLDDPDFQKREVFFQVDGNIIDSYAEIINHVSVVFRKDYGSDENDVTRDLQFWRKDVESGQDIKGILYPRVGARTADWLNYEYRIGWSLKGLDTVLTVPPQSTGWLKTNAPVVALSPPFQKRVVEIDADRSLFKEAEIRSCVIRFSPILLGKARSPKTVVLRDNDATGTQKVALYQDAGTPVAYQVTWYTNKGEHKDPLKILDADFLFLIPPLR